MEIIGPQLPPQNDRLARPVKSPMEAWKVGQLLNATGVSSQKNGQTTINIGGNLLLAQTQFPIKPGQALRLEVSSPMTMMVLKTINKAPHTSPPTTIILQPQLNLINRLQIGQTLIATLNHTTRPGYALLELEGTRINVPLSQLLQLTSKQAIKLEVVAPGALAALRILLPATNLNSIKPGYAYHTSTADPPTLFIS